MKQLQYCNNVVTIGPTREAELMLSVEAVVGMSNSDDRVILMIVNPRTEI